MSKNKNANAHDVGEEIEVAIGKTEAFIEKHQKQIIYGLLALIVIVCGVLLFNKFYLEPQEIEAQDQMAKGEYYFSKDSFQLAINGDDAGYIGYEEIIDKYSLTESGDLAYAYAGISYYKLGEYEKAAKLLSKFDGNDNVNVSPVINGLIGDAYVELNDFKKALYFYAEAYKTENIVFAPVFLKKAGLVHENNGEYDKAIALYTKIKEQYFQSSEAQDIEKYIERATLSK